MPRKILVLEDEEQIREFIVINLKRAGFKVLEASSGEESLEVISKHNDIDVVVLDVMLPGIDGFEVCRNIRQANEVIGIIMLTAKTQETDKIAGLSTGADDYIVKPFSPTELVARIDSLYRRVQLLKGVKIEKITSGFFELDIKGRRLLKSNLEVDLTQIEYSIVKYFIENKNKALSRDEILNTIWGDNYFGDWKTVDVNIRRIRQKIEDDPSNPQFIKTIWGYGYKWEG